MTLRVEIDRLLVTLHGIPRWTAEQVIAGLSEELRERLRRAAWPGANGSPLEIGAISISAESAALDAASLRAILAEHLAGEILRSTQVESAPAAQPAEEF